MSLGKTYPTCLTRDYLSSWSLEDGIREICQNCKDIDDNEVYRSGNDLIFNSYGGVIDSKNLLLGVGTKTHDDTKRGGFSEGLLLSLLIIAREGVELKFINGDCLWTPIFEFNQDYQCETLSILEESLDEGEHFNGVSITLSLDGKTADKVTDNTLFLQENYNHHQTSEGTILLEDQHKGRIYVGGLFVDVFDSEYGFDFPPECFELDRDRKSLKPFDIKWATKGLIEEMSRGEVDEELSDRLVSSMQSGDSSMEFIHHNFNTDNNESFKKSAEKLYNEKYDGMILTSDYEEAEKLKEDGNKNVAYVTNKSFVSLVKKSDSHQVVFGARKEKEVITVENLLDTFEEDWQSRMDTDMYEAWRELSDTIKERV